MKVMKKVLRARRKYRGHQIHKRRRCSTQSRQGGASDSHDEVEHHRRPTGHPGRGRFDADGAFTVQSFTPGDGLVPGRYRTRIQCWKVPPSADSAGVSYLPPGFQTPELVVEPNGPVEVSYDVPSAER